MIDIVNGTEWLYIVVIAALLCWNLFLFYRVIQLEDREKRRKNEKNGGDTPKGGAL